MNILHSSKRLLFLLASMFNNIRPSDCRVPVPRKGYFKDVHTMVLVSIFPRSGSTLLGYLLTAHRNMIIASEPEIGKTDLYDELPTAALLNYILYIDKMRFEKAKKVQSIKMPEKNLSFKSMVKRTYNKQERYMFVPNQWQARCESLQVIGIKNSFELARAISAEGVFEKFKERLKKAGIQRLKFIFTVRNPYDMISTGIVHRDRHPGLTPMTEDQKHQMLKKRIKNQFVELCEMTLRFFQLMEPQNIFVNRHEDIVATPAEQLSKLCDFLEVPAFPDYLDDCASIVCRVPSRSRHELEWPKIQKREMAELIDKYHFFRGYSWDS